MKPNERIENDFTVDWALPPHVHALVTTRKNGYSNPPYDALNLGTHVGDDEGQVKKNRQKVVHAIGAKPVWLNQVHGNNVVHLEAHTPDGLLADGAMTSDAGIACAVMVADCLPILLCNEEGTEVAAIHAGWRGVFNGVIESTMAKMKSHPGQMMAYLGPCIGPECFEVGEEVRAQFIEKENEFLTYFKPHQGRWLADLPGLAAHTLENLGVKKITPSGCCTVCDTRFYSYRREGLTGRFAALIWMDEIK